VPSEQEDRDATASRFVTTLVATVREVMAQTSRAFGLDHQFLALPNYVQVGSPKGEGLDIVNPDFTLRYDQSFPQAKRVAQAPHGTVDPAEGLAELDRTRNQENRFPVWVTIIGYAVQSAGLALILQPTVLSLIGAAITLAVVELSTRHVVSVASRLVAGFIQIAQLAFGVLIAAQVAGVAVDHLVTTEINRLGPWAPLVGVVVYGVGAMLNFGPPTSFLPWMLLILLTAYGGQWIGNELLGSYASGFGGGLTLIVFALAVSHRPNTPPTVSLVLPGFWLLVTGSLGLIGVTELIGTHSSAIFTATLISMMSIAVGVQTGLLLWRAAIQLTSAPHRRAFHD
jgi:hypothetical protein